MDWPAQLGVFQRVGVEADGFPAGLVVAVDWLKLAEDGCGDPITGIRLDSCFPIGMEVDEDVAFKNELLCGVKGLEQLA